MKYFLFSPLFFSTLTTALPLDFDPFDLFNRPTPSSSPPAVLQPLPPVPTPPPTTVTTPENCTAQTLNGDSTENGIIDQNCCTDLTIIYARGTSESGNVGLVAGPPMFRALRERLGAERVSVQGVEYPASVVGNINRGASGGPEMASLVTTALSQCRNTSIIVSGYSQGAMVVHNAFSAQGLSSELVKGVVVYGDPLRRQGIEGLEAGKLKDFCAEGDAVCETGGFVITPAHLSYGGDAEEAVDFVVGVAGLA